MTATDDLQDDEFVGSKVWDASILRRLSRYVRPHRVLFAKSFAVLALLFALELAGPWIWRHALDGPVAAASAARAADPAADIGAYVGRFWLWIAAYAAVMACAVLFRYFEVAQLNHTGQTVIADLRERLFRHMQGLDLSFFDRRPTGSLVTRVTSDVENLNEMFTSGLISLLFDLLKVVLLLGFLFTLHWQLALVVLAGTPFLIGVSLVFRGGARDAHRRVRARLSRLNGYLQEVLQGLRVVQVFRREERVSARFAFLLADYLKANLRTIFLFALFFPTIDFVVSAIQGTTLWVGGLSIAGGELSYGEFVQFWFYVAMLVAPIRELGERYNVLQSAFASAERIFDVLDTEARIGSGGEERALRSDGDGRVFDRERDGPLSGVDGGTLPTAGSSRRASSAYAVRFERVGFAYEAGVEVLHDVSFEIPAGATIAVVGATGAGKSTLVNLLLRFYDPTNGRITVDGLDLREWDLGLLRSRIGLVLQEDFLFAGSVRENLVMEREQVSEESLELALEASRADEVIARLPGGLSAEVAERGATFSTGERQLLAIARALAGDPGIVILDEATASVDSGTEAQIEAATRELLAGRSALVIAHRLSTVRRADRILVLHRGLLREQGTHEELLAANGIYARLYQLQFSEQNGLAVG